MQTLTCAIPCVSTTYDITIRSGLLTHLAPHLVSLGSRFALITDDRVASLYGERLCHSLSSEGLDIHPFAFPAGEPHKTRATKELLENQLFEKGLGRDSCVIALGGGVVTDLAGYLAATYCRGISLVMVPTSLLGMADASIGGKTSVNVPYGKNMLGCFYQPKKVLIDPCILKSLPIKEMANGAVEMIKHALIADPILLDYLEAHVDPLLTCDLPVLEKAIFDSCRIKKEIVEQDERESGKRHLLNFGHTVGHALETLCASLCDSSSIPGISHGEAVAIGLLVESRLSVQLGVLHQKAFDRIKQILTRYTLPLRLPSRFSIPTLLEAMTLDKKSLVGKPRFVILEEIGRPLVQGPSYCIRIEEPLIREALQWMNDDLCGH